MTPDEQGSQAKNDKYNVLIRMLLRHYAKNRRRFWRNDPRSAFVDACAQVEGPLAVLVIAPLTLANIILGRTLVPWLAQIAFEKITNGGAIVGLLSLAFIVPIHLSFKRYGSIPNIQAPFDTEGDRNLVNLYFVGILILLVVSIVAGYLTGKALPAF